MTEEVEFHLVLPAEEVNLLRVGETFRIVRRFVEPDTGQLYKVTLTAERSTRGEPSDPDRITWVGP